jgi:spermidine synthase
MAKSNATFDVITADPIHPRITGVGYLYTREYYESIRPRLRPGGVVTQWMPMYHISKASFDVAFRTFVSVFPNASFWYVRGHGLFVATVEPFVVPCGSASRRFADFRVGEDFQSIDITSFEQFLGHMLMDAGHIARYLRRSEDTRLNTDDNAYLEYKTPFEFLDRTEAIVAELKDYAGWDAKGLLEHCPDDVVARARQHFEQRVSRLVPELAEPIR